MRVNESGSESWRSNASESYNSHQLSSSLDRALSVGWFRAVTALSYICSENCSYLAFRKVKPKMAEIERAIGRQS